MANRTGRLKNAVLKPLHIWTGIVAGLVLSVIALTGSLIVFRAEFERAALPQGAAAGSSRRVAIDEAAREIARLRPDSHIRRVRIPQAPADPYIFQVESESKRTERIVSDAATGRVLGTVETPTVDWLVDLHRNLLAGKNGRKAVGIAGIVLFVLGASGVLMWLAGARNWRAWISVRRSGSTRRFNFELHRAAGLWAYGFLAVISFTGIELAFPDSFREAVRAVTGKPATIAGPKEKKGAKSMLSLDEYVQAGKGAMPDGVPVELRLPAPGKGPVDLRLYRAGDLALSGNHVYLDAATARVIQVDRVVDRPIGARFLAALSPIHYGEFGGVPVKIGWALLGITPVLLFITGLFAWWRPGKKKPRQLVAEKAGSEDVALAGR
jgi:uncharacterized iron-regulated membrane protein